MVHLDARTLGRLPEAVIQPGYDPTRVTPGIVHLGVGAFHRAHQAMYVDRLLAAGHHEWGICGVGLLPGDTAIRDVLADQDRLYTLVTVDPDGTAQARVIASVVDFLFAPDDPVAVLDRLSSPQTRIVSLTITEGGYSTNDATGDFEPRDPGTRHDLTGQQPPQSVLGFLVTALARRRSAGTVPFTVMSCDNIRGNGRVARRSVLAFAERLDPQLAAWIADTVAFPSSMVDRITPVTTDATRRAVSAAYGVEDGWPVRAESFVQWVLEDHFPAGRPPWETVGVQLVADVEAYELMKLRLLNAAHQAMGYLGVLAGETLVHEVCRDPLFVGFLLGYLRQEAIPTLRPVPGVDLDAYVDQLIARFTSEAIRDTLARQVRDGSDHLPKFLLPVVADQLAAGRPVDHCALVIAGWSRFLEGKTDAGGPVVAVDPQMPVLHEALAAERHTPGAFLDCRPVFGDLGAQPVLREAFVAARAALAERGARGAIEDLRQRTHDR